MVVDQVGWSPQTRMVLGGLSRKYAGDIYGMKRIWRICNVRLLNRLTSTDSYLAILRTPVSAAIVLVIPVLVHTV